MEAKERKPKRYSIHRIEDGGREYSINSFVLAEATTEKRAYTIAAKLGPEWYYGVAVWDHKEGTIDFGGVPVEETG
jgi:hypothetical protein